MTSQATSTYIIYKATSPSGKVYIGLTCQSLRARRRQHCVTAKHGQLFPSVKAAGEALGSLPGAINYRIKNGNPIQGFLFSLAPKDLDGLQRVAENLQHQLQVPRVPKQLKPLYASNGRVFPSLTHASRELGLQRHKFQYMIDRGYPYDGVTYTTKAV